ncbi:MAG: hypothetical protein GY856_04180 [bacterium]|nr:hypothetical protein [bacterium]
MAGPIPETEQAQVVRAAVSDERWELLLQDAQRRAEVVEATAARREETGESWRICLAAVAPDLHWATYLHWRRRYEARQGPAWERLLDERLPPPPTPISQEVRLAACMLRRADRSINGERARMLLIDEFGVDGGDISDSSLRRIWAAAGLTYEAPTEEGRVVGEECEHFNGGGGLALIAAADVELGASMSLAAAALEEGGLWAELQGDVVPFEEWEGERDDHGRFTPTYNSRWRALVEPGSADGRWATDKQKRQHVDLGELATLSSKPEKLAARLLCMGVTPLLTERRGFAGLEGPAGAWLGAMGVHAYMPATLSKSLAELGLLGVDQALWEDHAQRWVEASKRWTASGPAWMQWAIYIDATQDPYWTRNFAKSGKVSRVGRVMPCLTRIAISSGAGVGLVAATHAGAASLKKELLPLLERLDLYLGPGGEVGRLTVIDSEVGTAGLMWALHDKADRIFITVLKGQVLQGATIEPTGDWQSYRERDELREVQVGLNGKGAPKDGILVRGVEMRRPDSRRPLTTLFATNAAPEDLATEEIATAYLSRWPLQEQLFRDGRNGGGGNRSHGYGGEYVTHVALDTKLERAERSVRHAERRRAKADATQQTIRTEGQERKDPVARAARELAAKEARRREKGLERAEGQLQQLRSMPREIYARDTGRDSIMTCLKMSVLMLIEYVLKEYFGGLRMEWRTFIDQLVALPVTVRTTRHIRRYQIHANPRQPTRMDELRAACAEVTRRRIPVDDRRLVFEVVDPPAGGS